MQIENRQIELRVGGKKTEAPVTIEWKGERMMKSHSVRSTVKEIIRYSKSLDVVRIGIVGNPHTGKSTLSSLLAHLIHTMSDIPFTVRVFNKKNLLNFKDTIRTLEPANYILVFQDVSFLGANAEKKQIEMAKQAMTEIRHLDDGTTVHDVKIITIMEYHYTLGLDKYLRQADFRYFTSVGSSEIENMEKIVGRKYVPMVGEFQKMHNRAIVKGKFIFKLGKMGKFFVYNYRQPFIPLLFFNNDSLRYVVSPTRQWVDPICSICETADGNTIQNGVSVDKFLPESYDKFGEQTFKTAIKQELLINGIYTYSPAVTQARKYLQQALQTKLFSLEEIAVKANLSITKTRLDEKLDGVLS